MTQQAAIFEISAPAAPGGDAGFVSATTAPRSFIFNPNAVFPNNGPVRQNVFTTGNASGQDGLDLLTQLCRGDGLFPAIPLTTTTIEIDTSGGASYVLDRNLDVGHGCTLKVTDDVNPNLRAQWDVFDFTISGIVEIRDIAISYATATTVFIGTSLTLSGSTSVLNGGGSAYFFDVGNTSAFVALKNQALVTGSPGTEVFHVGATGALSIDLYDNADFSNTDILAITAGGTVGIDIHSQNVAFNPIYDTMVGVTVFRSFLNAAPNGEIVFQPGGTDVQPNVFTTETGVIAAATRLAGPFNFYFDFSFTGDTYTAVGSFVLFGGLERPTYIGLVDQVSGEIPDFQLSFQIAAPVEIRDLLLTCSAAASTFAGPAEYLTISGGSFVSCGGGGNLLYGVSVPGAELVIKDDATLGDGVNPCIEIDAVGASLFVLLQGNATLNANALTITVGTVTIVVGSPGVLLDASYWTMAGVTVILAYIPAPAMTFQPGGVSTGTTFGVEQGFLAYAAAIPATGVQDITINFDASASGDSFAATASWASLPTGHTLRGIPNVTDSLFPTLTTAFQLAPPAVVSQTTIACSFAGTVFTSAPSYWRLDYASVSCGAGTTLYAVPSSPFHLDLVNQATLGDGTNPCISIGAAGSFFLYMDASSILLANAFAITSGGTLTIIAEPGADIDHSYFGMNGVSVTYISPPVPIVTFQPGGIDSITTFTDFGQLCAYMAAAGGDTWTIYGQSSSTDVNIPDGTFVLPPNVTFIAMGMNTPVPTGLVFGDGSADCILSPPPQQLSILGFSGVAWNNSTASPVLTIPNAGTFVYQSDGFLSANVSATEPFASYGAATVSMRIGGNSVGNLGGGAPRNSGIDGSQAVAPIAIVAGTTLFLSLSDGATLIGPTPISGGSASSIIATFDGSVVYPNSMFSNPVYALTILEPVPPFVTFQPGGTDQKATFTVETELFQYLSDVSTTLNFTVYLDTSLNGDVFDATSDATFPANATLCGVSNQADGAQGQWVTGGFEFAGVTTLENVIVVVNTAPASATMGERLDMHNSTLYSIDGNVFSSIANKVLVNLFDGSILGLDSETVLHIAAGGQVTVDVYSGGAVNANAFLIDVGGLVVINVYSSSAFIDPSYYTTAGVTVAFNYAPAPVVTFQPGGTNNGTVFTDFGQLCGYIAAVGDLVGDWTISLDGAFSAGFPTIPAGTYPLPKNVTFRGLAQASGSPPTLILSADVVFNPYPTKLAFLELTEVLVENTGGPVITSAGGALIVEVDINLLASIGGQPLVASVGSRPTIIGRGDTNFSGLLFTLDATSIGRFNLYDGVQLHFIAITLAAGGTMTLLMWSAGANIADAVYTTTGFTVEAGQPGVVLNGTFATPNGVVTASPGQLFTTTNGGPGTTFWVKETGVASNTGWVGK